MLVAGLITPRIKFAGNHLYTWIERGTVRVKCLAQEHSAMTPARAPLEPLDLEMSAVTMAPLCFPLSKHSSNKVYLPTFSEM